MSVEDRPDDRRRDISQNPKKPYQAPRLVAYGDIAAVTQTLGMNGMSDGGNGTMKATQP
jgi:hypothetical protein